MQVLSGCVLLRITTEEKRKVFFTDLVTESGQVASLVKEIEADEGFAQQMEQSVQCADVVAVANDVIHIKVGDLAIIDYIVDTLDDKVVYKNRAGKIVCIDTRTLFHKEDNLVPQSLRSRQEMYAWSAGDVDEASLIYGVFRGDQLIPNPPYIICEHKDLGFTSTAGVKHMEYEDGCVIRRVLVQNAETDPEITPGTPVVVEAYCLYERILDGKKFDVIMNQDIEVSFHKE